MSIEAPYDYVNKIVTFNTYGGAVIGTIFDRVKITAILDFDSAMKYIDPISMHRKIYPLIPEAFQPANNPRQYMYFKIILQNGAVEVIGIPWISGSITIHETETIVITIYGKTSLDVPDIRKALLSVRCGEHTIDVQ